MSATECLHFMGKLSNMEKTDLKTRIKEVLILVGLEESANKKLARIQVECDNDSGLLKLFCIDQNFLY